MSENGIKGETLIEQLKWRYAVKQFDPSKKISEADWKRLEEALVLSPSSYGLQPYKFFVINDPELRVRLRPASYGQTQITDSSHLVALAARRELSESDIEHYVKLIEDTRGTSRDTFEDYIGMMKGTQKMLSETGGATFWAQKQVYIALGILLEAAALMGIDACPMEGFEPDKYDEILGLTDYTTTVLCTLGYRAEGDWLGQLKKVRFPRKALIETI